MFIGVFEKEYRKMEKKNIWGYIGDFFVIK